jgi:hypothetical protein
MRGLPVDVLDRIARWWPKGRVDQKRRDAVAMLRRIVEDRAAEGPAPFQVSFRFQHTDAWEQVRRQIDRRPLDTGPGSESFQHDAVLDELRLQPDRYHEVRRRALVRALALELAGSEGAGVPEALLERVVRDLLQRHQLVGADQVTAWAESQHLHDAELADLLEAEARAARVVELVDADLDRSLADVLRLDGHYGELARRAAAKQRALASGGLDNPTLELAGVDEETLFRWYVIDRSLPLDPSDRAAVVDACGFPDVDAMRRALLREYCFVSSKEPYEPR